MAGKTFKQFMEQVNVIKPLSPYKTYPKPGGSKGLVDKITGLGPGGNPGPAQGSGPQAKAPIKKPIPTKVV